MLVFIPLLLSPALALYSSSDDVLIISSASDFTKKIVESPDPVLVEFFAPWCGHCKSLVPEWKKAATALKGIMKVAAVDADQLREVGQQYGVQGFPTIKFFGTNKKSPSDYSGERTANAVVDFAVKELKSIALGRLGGKSGKSHGGSGSGSGSGSGGSGPSAVVQLTAANFEEKVLESGESWLVEFFAPWCGHCKNLAPVWEAAAKKLKGKVNVGAVDATVESSLGQQYGIRGYPTIKVFRAGSKKVEDYQGGRTESAIVDFALAELYEDKTEPRKVEELTNADIFTTECAPPNLCVISFLPDLLDTGASGRNGYIEILRRLAVTYKRKPLSFLWAGAMQQGKLEAALDVGGSGYPALVVMNAKKQRFGLMVSAFTEASIAKYLDSLLSGRETTVPLPDLSQKVIVTRAWDGKDAKVDAEQEIDLSELGINVPDSHEDL